VPRQRVDEPGCESAADADGDTRAASVAIEHAQLVERVVLFLTRRDGNTGGDRGGHDRMVDAGRQRGDHDVDAVGDRVTRREVDSLGSAAESFGDLRQFARRLAPRAGAARFRACR